MVPPEALKLKRDWFVSKSAASLQPTKLRLANVGFEAGPVYTATKVSNVLPKVSAASEMLATGVKEIVSLVLRGKDAPLGIFAVGSGHDSKLQDDEVDYLKNIANLLGLTVQNVLLFEQVDKVQRQWAYTFDSIGDPIFVHDGDGSDRHVPGCTLFSKKSASVLGV